MNRWLLRAFFSVALSTVAFAQYPDPYLAKDYLSAASAQATHRASDAQLYEIIAPDMVQSDGTDSLWIYFFYSASKDTNYIAAFLNPKGVLTPNVIDSSAGNNFYSPLPNSNTWINSDTAIMTADANGGNDFRANHPDPVVSMYLQIGLYAQDFTLPVWEIAYQNQQSTAFLYIYIDALNDSVLHTTVSSVGESSRALPANHLNQNYPNPFTSSTAISFSLANSQYVSLGVYNVLGEEITNLEKGIMSAGAHTFNFNAVNVPEGVYYYRLIASDGSQIKPMMIVK